MTQLAHLHHPGLSATFSVGLLQRHPVLSYYVLVFTISWGGVLLVGGRGLLAGTNW